ncbi:hypothetical protein (plasmid) [Lactobacillus salivarius str. Ren] [Lactiplantibacillus mudanjiangensis]|uniref:hypothetical protein n=1 Tax=Lactiplantibacillus mudanjiangensis TaxID=1296538 RepID=UPI00101429D7|nr:hypothetical protein (plasmid) [Lactobacillus salivarius str. Ren] [Lactiplantibacillus mudanjiangensis]
MNERMLVAINGLKTLTNNGQKSFQIVNIGGVFEEKMGFNTPISVEDLQLMKQLALPSDYYDLLQLSNGLSLFQDSFQGMALGGAVCEIYDAETVCQKMVSSTADRLSFHSLAT